MARERDDYDDEDDRPARRSEKLGPLDKMFRDTNIIILVLFALCCGIIAAVLSLICVLTAKDPKAKSNATITLAISAILTVVGIVLQVVGAIGGAAAGR